MKTSPNVAPYDRAFVLDDVALLLRNAGSEVRFEVLLEVDGVYSTLDEAADKPRTRNWVAKTATLFGQAKGWLRSVGGHVDETGNCWFPKDWTKDKEAL